MSTVASPMIASPVYPGVPQPMPVRIISIFPVECRHHIMLHNQRDFVLPAAARGEWTYLDIEDDWVWLRDLNNLGADNPTPGIAPVPAAAAVTAFSLVSFWCSATAGTVGAPGIACLPPLQSEPSKEFLGQLKSTQETYFRHLVLKANDLKQTGKERDINELYRAAAEWLYGRGASRLPWYQKAHFEDLKHCLGCGREILIAATVCEHCHVDIVDLYRKRKLDPSGDPAVAAVLSGTVATATLPDEDPIREIKAGGPVRPIVKEPTKN